MEDMNQERRLDRHGEFNTRRNSKPSELPKHWGLTADVRYGDELNNYLMTVLYLAFPVKTVNWETRGYVLTDHRKSA